MSVVFYAWRPGFLVATHSLMEDPVQCEDADCVAAPAVAM